MRIRPHNTALCPLLSRRSSWLQVLSMWCFPVCPAAVLVTFADQSAALLQMQARM